MWKAAAFSSRYWILLVPGSTDKGSNSKLPADGSDITGRVLPRARLGYSSRLSASVYQPDQHDHSPGIGKMSSPLECTQASASCPGVQPFLSASSLTISTSFTFCSHTLC